MPLYDFRCPHCGHVKENLFKNLEDAIQATVLCEECHVLRIRLASAPASVIISGFSADNGYTHGRTIQGPSFGGIKTEVKGNFERFSDGVVPK